MATCSVTLDSEAGFSSISTEIKFMTRSVTSLDVTVTERAVCLATGKACASSGSTSSSSNVIGELSFHSINHEARLDVGDLAVPHDRDQL